jgi:RHS repeat-associated protein
LIDYYEPDIVTAQDYYPFGMLSREALPNSDVPYKFGFNGKMNDNDVKGGYGLQQDYGMRIYDGRVGRFLSVDPLTKGYPELTPYQFASNRPIDGIDLDGEEWKPLTDYFADKAKANGYPRLSGFIRSFGAGDVQTQTQDANKNVAKGKIAEVAVQVYGYTSTGMFENSVKLAKKAIIDRDPEAQGEALGMLAQGAFGEVLARARPAAPRVYEEPVTATNKQATAASSGNSGAAKANAANSEASVGAMKRMEYEAASYHGKVDNAIKSKAPVNGQEALDLSVQVKETSPRRVGVDYATNEYVVFDRTQGNTYHGHVRSWADLHSDMQRALIKSGMADKKGKIIQPNHE